MGKDLYAAMKGLAYEAACTAAGYDNAGAKIAGYRDVYDVIMSDSDDPKQALFLALIMEPLSEPQRQVLLDGLAQEYQHCEGWMSYVDRECD